jgi:hypothetical protein
MPSVQPAQLISRIPLAALCVALSAWMPLSASAAQPESSAQAAPADDGWRRTVDGWERMESWSRGPVARRTWRTSHHSVVSVENEAVPARRSDFHPAILVVLQLLAVTGAYSLIPATIARRNEPADRNGVEPALNGHRAGVLVA